MFRVGLLFATPSPDLGALPRLTFILDRIAEESAVLRADKPLTLVPFVRTGGMAVFAQTAATGRAVEAAAFDHAGVSFVDLGAFIYANHPPYDHRLDFDLGLRVVLPRCDVVIVVCANTTELADAQVRVSAFRNMAALVALIQLDEAVQAFFRLDNELA